MSDIVRVVEEEFDDEGNLVRRTTTEYGNTKDEVNKFPNPTPAVYPDPVIWPYHPSYVGDVWPYGGYGQIVTSPEKYTLWNTEGPSTRVDTPQFSGAGNGEGLKFTGCFVDDHYNQGTYSTDDDVVTS